MTTTDVAAIARERQLDWLLGEVLGGEDAARRAAAAPRRTTRPWLVAAVVLLGVAVAFGAALFERDPGADRAPLVEPPQDPIPRPTESIEWHECHGPAQLHAVPIDVENLRCYDFDDAALARLPGFGALRRLDLSGLDVNDHGYAVSLPITDAGVRHLAALTNLRSLSLEGCHHVDGSGLRELEALPRLEHLDLTFTGVQSPAVERLHRLPSLRSLSLSFCMEFHGRSLAEVAKIPGLVRLELRGCTTVSANDALHLAKSTHLRHLDLRDCQGRYRGQRAARHIVHVAPEPDADPPVEDGIGITDEVVAALGDLPLETLQLGGCESLTDAIGPTLARMATLRALDLSHLPNVTNILLSSIPPHLTSLALEGNAQLSIGILSLPTSPMLRELDVSGSVDPLPLGTPEGLAALLDRLQLHALAVSGLMEIPHRTIVGLNDVDPLRGREETGNTLIFRAIARQESLRILRLPHTDGINSFRLGMIAALPELSALDLSGCHLPPGSLLGLSKCKSLVHLDLRQADCGSVTDLQALPHSLRELDLYGTKLDADAVREALSDRDGLVVTLPQGQRFRVP